MAVVPEEAIVPIRTGIAGVVRRPDHLGVVLALVREPAPVPVLALALVLVLAPVPVPVQAQVPVPVPVPALVPAPVLVPMLVHVGRVHGPLLPAGAGAAQGGGNGGAACSPTPRLKTCVGSPRLRSSSLSTECPWF